MLKSKTTLLTVLSLILLIASPLPCLPQASQAQDTTVKDKNKVKKTYTGIPVLWREPTDIESRNLLLGAGGETMKPDLSRVTFIEEKKGGWSTKYRVRDGAGNEWIAPEDVEQLARAVRERINALTRISANTTTD